MDFSALIQTIAIAALPVIFAITLHEAAHGYAARHFGDPTAWQAGRISLNPLRHIDPVGTLLVPGLILLTSYLAAGSAMLFGWAKPVPVDPRNFRHPYRDMALVAAAAEAVVFRARQDQLEVGLGDHPPGGRAHRRAHQARTRRHLDTRARRTARRGLQPSSGWS